MRRSNYSKAIIAMLSAAFLFMAAALALVFLPRSAYAQEAPAEVQAAEADFTDDSVIVVLDSKISKINKIHNAKFFDGIEISFIKDLTKRTKNKKSKNKDFRQILQIYLKEPSEENVLRAVEKLQSIDGVYSAEPNYIYEASKSANDTYYANGSQWNLNGANGIDISQAWDITTGSSGVRVGVIDTGIAAHPDLNANLASGWDFHNNNSITTDDTDPHGTQVAGIIGAVGNNGTGVAGINWEVTLVPMQASNENNKFEQNDVIAAIQWAIDRDGTAEQIDILNYSVSGFGESDNVGLLESIREYDGLFVWSAGNDGNNVDAFPDVELFNLENCISVGAHDKNNSRSTWGTDSSNYGNHVDIFAPGGQGASAANNIPTTTINNGYYYFKGTSAAAPHVAGVAALLLAVEPTLTSAELKDIILDNADTITISVPNGTQQVKKLNAYEAVQEVKDNDDFSNMFAGGSGMRHDPYLVSNAEQFRNIRHAYRIESVPYTGPEKQIFFSFKLTNNITLTGDWEPFEYPLTGLLDGDGHYVTYNMTLTQSEVAANTDFGLFRTIKETGQVKNLELRNCSITSDTGTVLNAGENKIVGLGILAGGITKAMEHSAVRVTNPVINCNISHAIVGGIGGSIYTTSMTNCVVSGGTLTNYNGALGGMAGYGDIVYFSGGSCSTTLTKENYEDTDQIGEVVGNSTSTSTVSCSVTINRNGSCVAEGTLITLADGTQVPVEELDGDEFLLVWDFETGQFGAAPIVFIDSDPERTYRVIELTFSDGTEVEVISEHGFWDRTLNEFVYLGEDAAQYIGHWFDKRAADAEGDFSGGYVQLTAVTITEEVTAAYSPVTQGHLCYFVNGMLSMPGGIEGIFNIFEVDPETMAYDAEAFAEDIEEYGLYTYEEFAQEYPISEEAFEAFGCKYFKVALGKGVVTETRLVQLMNRYAEYLI